MRLEIVWHYPVRGACRERALNCDDPGDIAVAHNVARCANVDDPRREVRRWIAGARDRTREKEKERKYKKR